MNKITLKVLLGITILISAFHLVGCDNSVIGKKYNISSYPKEQKKLIEAIKKADLETVKDLAYKIDLETTNKDGVTILKASIIEASIHKKDSSFPTRVEIISELVRAGANPNNSSGPGYSPYGLATSSMTTENIWILKALLDGGMSADLMRGNKPLISDIIISIDEDMEPLKLLIEAGANVNIRAEKGFAPILDTFSSRYNVCAALYLAENGADLDVTSPLEATVAWFTFVTETELNDGTAFSRYDYPGLTIEQREAYIEKQKQCVVKLKEILIAKGYDWPPKEPEPIRKNREESERKEEEKRLYREKYYPKN